MSNKIALATIQFRADAKGANVALDSLMASAKEARKTVDEMQDALNRGIKTMKDANGVDFDVEAKLKAAKKEANNFEQALRELMKGATALESVVKNIRLGEIEKSSRAELKGAINAAESRKRSVRGDDEESLRMQRELNIVIEESRKQLNNLDRDTQKVIETLKNGGVVAESVLEKEQKGLKEILSLIPKGTDEYKQYAAQLKEIQTYVANIRQQEQTQATALLGEKNLGKYSEEQIRAAISSARELIQTYKTASPEAKALADNIVRAEQHLKDYGIEAARAAAKETAQIKTQEEAEKQLRVTMNKRLTELPKLSAEALAETKKYWEAQRNGAEVNSKELARYEANLKKVMNQEQKRRVAQLDNVLTQPSAHGIAEVRAALAEMEKLRDSVRQGTNAWLHYNKMVEQGRAYLDGLDLSRITNQMNDLQHLSASGLAEVKKYWETMVAGAAKGSTELGNYEAELKKVIAEEQQRQKDANWGQAHKLLSGNFGSMNEGELRTAIEAAKEYQKTLITSGSVHKDYTEAIVKAEEHLRKYGTETERAAQKQREADELMRQQLQQGTALSESALRAQEQYWRRLIDDPKTAADSIQAYEQELQKVIALQKQQAETTRDERAGRLGGSLSTYSEAEIRQAIEAGKQLIQTYKTGDAAAKTLAKDIVAAEEYLKQYGVEAERTAVREAKAIEEANKKRQEQIDLMVKQYNESRNAMSDSALKAHERFWQQLIDDPKTATKELENYRKNLEIVQNFIKYRSEQNVKTEGQNALRFFQGGIDNASANEIKQNADALKKYRDSLPQRDNAELIKEIDGYLEKTGKTAATATEELMGLSQAMGLSANAGKTARGMTQEDMDDLNYLREKKKYLEENLAQVVEGSEAYEFFRDNLREVNDELKKFSFSGTTDDLQKAQKSIEQAIATTDKGTPKYDRLRMALARVKAEMAGAGISAQKTQEVLKNPTAEKSVDTLKAAVARARAEMEVMAQRSERLKRLIEEAGSNGNTKHRLKDLEQALKENDDALKSLTEDTKQADFAQKQLANTAKGSATAFEKAWSRLKTYVTLYVGAAAAMQKFTATFGDMMELSDKMGEVQKTTQMSNEAVGRLSQNLAKLDVRTPLTQLMEISAAAGQLGLKTEEDIQGFTEAANMLMIALPEMGKEAATEMMRVAIATGEVDKIRKQMQEGVIDGSSATAVAMTKIASTIDRLRASSAATAPEITDFVKRVGAVGAQSGISIDQVSALGSTISSLGLRIEMSATALSRMIPAIRRNAFELSQAIGVSPEAVRSLFDAGRGMEAVLMILQRMKDQSMDADSIEKMLGMGGMQEIMKDLNQQGARAGIVFAGLSQNVDELRRQLGVASQAYEENIAIQQEFDRMNDTTAAKWERLKNQIEEAFVSDTMQSWLGSAIDGVRWLVDALAGRTGLSAALTSILMLVGLLKLNAGAALWGMLAAGFTKITALCKNFGGTLDGVVTKMKAMTAAQWTNWIFAVVAALGALIYKLKEMSERAAIVANEMAKLDAEVLKQTKTVDGLFHTVAKTNAELDVAKKRLEEVKKANEDTTDAENKLKKASTDHAAAIRDINSKYGQYLGYMLSETARAEQLAAARDLINAKLRETITLKQREAALGNIEQEYGGQVNKKASSVERTLEHFYGNDYDRAARVSVAISEAAQKYANDSKKYQEAVKKILADNKIQRDVAESYMDTFEGYRKSIEEYNKQENAVMNRFEARSNVARKDSREKAVAALNSIMGDWKKLVADYQKAEGEEKEKLAVEVYKQQRSYANAVANNAEYFENDKRKQTFDKNLKNMQTYEKGLRDVAGEAIRTVDALERAESKITNIDYTNGGESNKNPWGNAQPADSTSYTDMNATALVNRRKQMKDFVNAIQTDSDVQTVLGEDAALKKAIEGGMSSDMRTVIEWYNTERLKIQDELYKRHLTNTGDWLDPKKSRESWRKQLQMDLDNYLKMLDAYYTKRKAEIQEAGNDEGLSEAEIRNRQIANDTEWQQRRLELQQIYLGKREQVAKDEVTAIMNILAEMDEDTPEMVEKLIGKSLDKWKILEEKAPEMARRLESKFVSGVSASMLKMQHIVAQQMKAIQDIIDKERPFNGITKNLRENLVTMDILTADMRKERDQLMKDNGDMTDFNRRQAEEEVKRTTFLLGEAEKAYSTTVEEVMARMGKAGMEAWAEEIRQSPQMQEALMAQLHQTYDQIQEAIKKEASLMKKQAETMWNNILLPGGEGKTTVKDAFEKAIAQLGVDQGRVNRANSLIGAGQASERVADKLAIKQMQLQLTMQEHYYNLIRKQGMQRIKDLERQIELAKQEGDIEKQKRLELDKQHADMSLNLAMTKEQTELLKQQEEIIARTEESQNRLYTHLREWGDLLANSVREVMEASNAGLADYYNERAKLDLTGKGGPGAGTYIVIDNAGTSDATAHYEQLDERQALERQLEIEQQNAQAEAWRKVMDDINAKMNEQITDWMNAALQNQSTDANTDATLQNTSAIVGLTEAVQNQGGNSDMSGIANGLSGTGGAESSGVSNSGLALTPDQVSEWTEALGDNPMLFWSEQSDLATQRMIANMEATKEAQVKAGKTMASSAQSTFAKMTQAANLYGVAYQAMSNENLSTSQKFQMFALQAAGQAAIGMLTTNLLQEESNQMVRMPGILGKLLGEMPYPAAMATYAAVTALLGGLMGMAVSKISKSKSQIAQVTGASANAGRLTTGMLAYAEGNVNEFTDPSTLTPGRQYDVDAADGRTYRARYMGRNPKTHLTNGPEFHLSGEKGREMIIDAGTTRQITMNEGEIWHAIQTLSAGGRLSATRRRRGVRAFADGNVDDFETMEEGRGMMADGGMGFDPVVLQASLDRNSAVQEALLERLSQPIQAKFDVYGKGGLVDSYDTGKKTVTRHGERY